MALRQIISAVKKEKWLAILLIAFFVKQLLMIAVFPIFQGPDETVHFSRIQKIVNSQPGISRTESESTYQFSEEIDKTMEKTEADKIFHHSSATQDFSDGKNGPNEAEIKNNQWDKTVISNYKGSLLDYYSISSLFTKIFSKSDIFNRFFPARIFSAILGTLIILFCYLTFKKIGFNEKVSILLSCTIAFQPMFSQASAIVNYDILLIFFFAFFIYGAACSLKDGLNWKNISIMILAILLGVSTKAPAIALIPIFLALIIYLLTRKMSRRAAILWIASLLIGAIIIFGIAFKTIIPSRYNPLTVLTAQNSKFDSLSQSVSKYLSLTKNRWDISEVSYWGYFGWLDTKTPYWITGLIHYIEFAGIIGLFLYLFAPNRYIPQFLPKRKFAFFFAALFLALQLAVRFADWAYFNSEGIIGFGTPGRYFLPVIGVQTLLIFIGLAMLFRKYNLAETAAKIIAAAMIIFWTYSVLIIIIPRYYL